MLGFVSDRNLGDISFAVSENEHCMTHSASSSSRVLPLMSQPHQYRVSYDFYEAILLEAPYKTRCRRYRNNLSRAGCLKDCLKEGSIREMGVLPRETSVRKEDEQYKHQSMVNSSEVDNFIEGLRHSCGRQCNQRECQSLLYIPRIDSSSPYTVANLTPVLILAQTTPVIRAVSQASIPLITLLTNIGSTLGLWLGLSVSTALPAVIKGLNRIQLSNNKPASVRQSGIKDPRPLFVRSAQRQKK